MTARDGFTRGMDPLALDADREERLVRGELDAGDVPPDYQVANGPAPPSVLAGPSSTPGKARAGSRADGAATGNPAWEWPRTLPRRLKRWSGTPR